MSHATKRECLEIQNVSEMIYSIQGLVGASEFERLSTKTCQVKKAKTKKWSSISCISGFRYIIGWKEGICTGQNDDTHMNHMTYVHLYSLHITYEDRLVACMCFGADTRIFF